MPFNIMAVSYSLNICCVGSGYQSGGLAHVSAANARSDEEFFARTKLNQEFRQDFEVKARKKDSAV
jgi:hypothetical protein